MQKNQKIWIGLGVVLLVAVVLYFGLRNQSRKAGDENVIKIGAILPLTGNTADLGNETRKGIELCVENWNAKGGLLNRSITTVVYDSKADPKEGRTLANKMLASENNLLLIYSMASAVTLNVKPVTEEHKTLLLACIGSTNLFDGESRHTLRNYISPNILGHSLINALKKEFSKNEITIFYVNNEQGLSYKKSVEEAALKNMVAIKKSIPYEDSSPDYKNIILATKLQNEDVLYVTGSGISIGRIIKQIRECGFNGTILCDSVLLSNSSLAIAGEALKNTFVLDYLCDTSRDDYFLISEQYKKNYGEEIGIYALLAYQGLDTIFRFVQEQKITNFQSIPEQIDGYEIDSFLGHIKIQQQEFVFPLKLKPVISPE